MPAIVKTDRPGRLSATALVAAVAATCLIAPAAPPTEAKAPGVSHCYRGVCHRVRTVEQTRRLIGQTMIVVTSHYDMPGIDRFNTGRLTSNGEVFDANDPDRAASADLPDGTELLLRNPENGLVSFVRVNDFGPFRGDRRLDVTRRVAEDLGFAKKGLTALEVIVIAAPRPEDLKYQRNRPRVERHGHLGAVDPTELPQLVAELIAERNPLPDGQQDTPAEAQVAIAQPPVALAAPPAAAVEETFELVPASTEADTPIETDEAAQPLAATPEQTEPAAASTEPDHPTTTPSPELSPTVLALLGPPSNDLLARPPIVTADASPAPERASYGLAVSAIMDAWTGLRSPASRQTLLMALMGLLSSLLVAQAMSRPAARRQRRAVPVRTAAACAAAAPQLREALSSPAAPSPLASSTPVPVPAPTLPEPSGSLLGPQIEIDGELGCTGRLAIAGRVRGRVAAHHLVILAGGSVEGEIAANTVVIEGTCNGRIVAAAVEIGAQAEVSADIETAAIAIREGACVEATFSRPRNPI